MAATEVRYHPLTRQELETRQRQLEQETQTDQRAVQMGLLDKPELLERVLYREFEQRWLEMEALLLKN
jgi:hypothetical protein